MAEVPAHGPAARVVFASVPAGVEEARVAGCTVRGHNMGSGLHNLLLLAGGDLEQLLTPDPDGVIRMVLLAQALGWAAGTPASEVGSVDFRFMQGRHREDGEFVITPASFDPDGEPRMAWGETPVTPRRWLETSPGRFDLVIPAFDDFAVGVVVDHAVFAGPVRAAGEGGFAADEGATLTGYVTREAVLGVIEDLLAACAGDDPPGLCNLIGGVIPPETPPEEALGQVLGFFGGFDVRYEGGGFPVDCDDDDEDEALPACNAISMCLELELEPVTIAGVEE